MIFFRHYMAWVGATYTISYRRLVALIFIRKIDDWREDTIF